MNYFIGVDVGTGSVRAALVTSKGKIIKTAIQSIKTFNPQPDFYEQSSNEIWKAVCHVVRTVSNDLPKENIKGIGFDATCSLVVLDKDGLPVSVNTSGIDEQNIILWMDHRAHKEAAYINELGHELLKYVGGKISLEMEIPKLLWLKNNLPNTWSKAKLFFDLPDFLTWKATNSCSRSLCSLVCKWNYVANKNGINHWQADFFDKVGLEDLKKDNWSKIGNDVKSPGEPVGHGLSKIAAIDLNLLEHTPVGTSIIDAHAGGLGMLGCQATGIDPEFTTRLALICGTSTCHMIVSNEAIFVNGVWGPYFNAMAPDLWLNEGGQSATGKLIDYIIDNHPASSKIVKQLNGKMHIQEYLNNYLSSITKKEKQSNIAYLSKNLHIWPDFHGNRSPLADPSLCGMISGLKLSNNEEELAILYLATLQALVYGTKHILEVLIEAGHNIKVLLICGGLNQNVLFVQTHADALGLPVLCPVERESVLLGSAILGACAANHFISVNEAIVQMGGLANVVFPNTKVHLYHEKKYKVFRKMVEDQKKYHRYMTS